MPRENKKSKYKRQNSLERLSSQKEDLHMMLIASPKRFWHRAQQLACLNCSYAAWAKWGSQKAVVSHFANAWLARIAID